ncbi:hypothetical protein [Streptomyces sp. NRRL B-24085]|uniref:hypothetical protein n=1 Tax=Streptomyces sp. NRRL B-24085 TaxID=1709476 RepID=UPI0006B3BBC9|nr:hypothetical protein [Streptomyces sp. NRRL B-24085]
MRSPLLHRAAVVLVAVAALQSASPAMADDKNPDAQSGSIDPITPFLAGASTLAAMAEPFYNAVTGAASPRG